MEFPHNDRNTYVCVYVHVIGYIWDVQNSEFKMGSFFFMRWNLIWIGHTPQGCRQELEMTEVQFKKK